MTNGGIGGRFPDVDLTDLDRFADGFPHDVFARLRSEAPVWWHPPTAHTPGGEGFWVVSRYDDVLAAATDAVTFSSDGSVQRPTGGGTLIEDLPGGFAAGVLLNMQDDPRHQQIRKLVTPAVAPRALAAMEPELRGRAEQIVDDVLARGDSCDFLVEIAAELPLQAIARLLGVPQEDRHQLFAWAETTLDHDDRDPAEQARRAAAASAAMFDYATHLVAAKRADPDDGMLSAVANWCIRGPGAAAADEPLADLEVQMFFSLLVAAGSETTRNSIASGLLGFMADPAEWQRLHDDRSLMATAVEETLRWASSTTYNRRTATRDTDLGGQAVAAGDKVTLWWGSADFDERQFPDPFTFDIARTPNRHLAFGHGSHFCLGANLARLEIRLLFDVLLDRFRSIEQVGPVEWTRSNKHTGIRHLPVRLLPR
ncbi:MAG: cytochrome P450 [Acidimicrobiales bacterium]